MPAARQSACNACKAVGESAGCLVGGGNAQGYTGVTDGKNLVGVIEGPVLFGGDRHVEHAGGGIRQQ